MQSYRHIIIFACIIQTFEFVGQGATIGWLEQLCLMTVLLYWRIEESGMPFWYDSSRAVDTIEIGRLLCGDWLDSS